MEDIESAVKHLFNYSNVEPFLAKRLIQRLVKSNPTPQYILTIANIFNNKGFGVRGDMKAVVKTILMHSEAISCSWMNDSEEGKLREPILKYTDFVKAVGLVTPFKNYWNLI